MFRLFFLSQFQNIYIALKKLSEKRLVANANPKYSEIYKEGVVFSQSPISGTYVKKGRIINFSVSLGNMKMSLKDFRGVSLPEFYEFLKIEYPNEKFPYKIATFVYEFSDTIEKGKIFKQEPVDGTPIKNVTELKLWVSNGIKDKEYKVLPKFIGKKAGDVTTDLANCELLYTFKYNLVKFKKDDEIITEQSIGENAIIDDIVKENKILELTINKYFEIEKEKITGTFTLEIPKKPIPFLIDVRGIGGEKIEKSLLKLKMKGGVLFPIPYSLKLHTKLNVYINGTLYKEVDLIEEEKRVQEKKL